MDTVDLSEQYQVLEELGSGSFGVVYKAVEKVTGDTVAIKLIDLESSDDDIQDIQQEISVLSTCNSPFVTQYKTSFLRGHKLWIVMEYLGGGSCLDLLRNGTFHEQHVAVICRELLSGLSYLHEEGKIHRDVKAANILLAESGKVKLADFGVAAQLTNLQSQRNTFVGTPFWMAPEVIQQAGYDFKADIWSLGITAMELIHGEPPHASTHPMKVLFLIPKASAPRLEGQNYSKEFRDFVAACLVKDPDRRPTAKELLQHRFVQNAGQLNLIQLLIKRRQSTYGSKEEAKQLKLYEETLRPLAVVNACDDFVFDTIRTNTMIGPCSPTSRTQRLPEENRIPEDVREHPEAIIGRLTLEESHEIEDSISVTRRCIQTMKRRASLTNASTPAKRRSFSQKQPLVPSVNFGNSPSSRKQFCRLPSDAMLNGDSATSDVMGAKNSPKMPGKSSKEAMIAQRAYTRAINQSFQDICAQTGSPKNREALSQVAQAWDRLNNTDPDGEYALLSIIIERIHGDSKLASLIPDTSSNNLHKPKLVLAQNNPHLKSHRRRESSLISRNDTTSDTRSYLSEKLIPGLEHQRQLADALYSKWVAGLRNRWPTI